MATIIDDDDDDDGSNLIENIIFDDPEETSIDDGDRSENQTIVHKRNVASIRGESVDKIYKQVVSSVKETLGENDVVDIELTFRASSIRGGIPIISRNKESNVVEIRLATRISGSPKKNS